MTNLRRLPLFLLAVLFLRCGTEAGPEMSTFPPDGFDVTGTDVTWGTDINFTESSSALTGDGYWNWLATDPTGNPGLIWDTPIPIEGGSPYAIYAPVYASSINASDKMRIGVSWLDESEGAISTVYAFDSALDATGTWENHGGVINAPSNARFAQPVCEAEKGATSFTARMDRLDFWEMPVAFKAHPSTNQSFAGAGVDVKKEFATENYDYGNNFDNVTNHRWTAPAGGLYSVTSTTFCFTTAAPDSNMWWISRLYRNGSLDFTMLVEGDNTVVLKDGIYQWLRSYTTALPLDQGDYLEIFFDHTNTADVIVGASGTFFAVARVE